MASPEWVSIFRAFTLEELAAKKAELRSEITVFSAHGTGNRNYQRDLNALKDMLAAIQRVEDDRAHPIPRHFVHDFNGSCQRP